MISLGFHQNIGLHTGAHANVVLLTYLLKITDILLVQFFIYFFNTIFVFYVPSESWRDSSKVKSSLVFDTPQVFDFLKVDSDAVAVMVGSMNMAYVSEFHRHCPFWFFLVGEASGKPQKNIAKLMSKMDRTQEAASLANSEIGRAKMVGFHIDRLSWFLWIIVSIQDWIGIVQ